MSLTNFKKWVEYISGYKSYITAVMFGVYEVLRSLSVINTNYDQDIAIKALILTVFGMSIRHAISKVK